MTALVTGASGFLGRHVVAALRRAGVPVRALVRGPVDMGSLGWGADVDVVHGDLETSNLAQHLAGIDMVVHLAAAMDGDTDKLFRANVLATERLLMAMNSARCGKMILLSSISIYDFSAAERVLSERSLLHSVRSLAEVDDYTYSKWWQEWIARKYATDCCIDLTILRPGFIWGQGRARLAPIALRLARFHLAVGPQTRLPLTHVENCADVVASCVLHPAASIRTFNVFDDEGPSLSRYLSDYLRGTGERAAQVPVPFALARSIMALASRVARVIKPSMRLPGLFYLKRFDARFKPLKFDGSAIKLTLGWSPPFTYEECLIKTYKGSSSANEHA